MSPRITAVTRSQASIPGACSAPSGAPSWSSPATTTRSARCPWSRNWPASCRPAPPASCDFPGRVTPSSATARTSPSPPSRPLSPRSRKATPPADPHCLARKTEPQPARFATPVTVGTAVGVCPCCDDEGVAEQSAVLCLQPAEVADVTVVGYLPEFDLNGEDSAVTLDDEIDLVITAAGAEVADLCFGGLGVGPDGLGYQGFEQRAEQRSSGKRCHSSMSTGDYLWSGGQVRPRIDYTLRRTGTSFTAVGSDSLRGGSVRGMS